MFSATTGGPTHHRDGGNHQSGAPGLPCPVASLHHDVRHSGDAGSPGALPKRSGPRWAGSDQRSGLALADDLTAGHRQLRLEGSTERGDGPWVIAAVLVDVMTMDDDVLVAEVAGDIAWEGDRAAVAQLAVALG